MRPVSWLDPVPAGGPCSGPGTGLGTGYGPAPCSGHIPRSGPVPTPSDPVPGTGYGYPVPAPPPVRRTGRDWGATPATAGYIGSSALFNETKDNDHLWPARPTAVSE